MSSILGCRLFFCCVARHMYVNRLLETLDALLQKEIRQKTEIPAYNSRAVDN